MTEKAIGNFKPLYSAFVNDYFLNSYIDVERKLLLHQPSFLLKENKWQIVPNTDDNKILNSFYNQFPSGIEGTKENCIEQVKDYKY